MNSRKVIRISSKRQLTIPQKFFDKLGFDSEAECILRDNELVIRPLKESGGEFAAEILADLVEQGYSGQELVKQFKIMQKKIRPAVEKMLEEAERVAEGKSEYYTMEDVFGSEDK
ncbi:MAG: AbrB/MazE/SpoVT family DNA-binding domain-containing protein [Eubacteriales bacterium]|nr:AbrB/MazE/SpoVT family DNA-binding domain-containing protein [Eubacteriales bacterium]MDD3200228.1 AbrB/MazE/SpoVT family DNA-binding domain-containing protein [Eubacteriales bacterium]MDD4122461.1 AbrB/MazE/SpoVT family DNA-binding domain-containing protein [Eubacteriales bacterium]MDD4630488.1 AbrB/MazE/SpoVT family DNA-binding domain-containing protein [Eubacteriales bacterium]